ncbi:Uncharacterised protein [Kluyvera cryocrescens]|nr:Uncharacterised protein [Kluyvera cryocrescens]
MKYTKTLLAGLLLLSPSFSAFAAQQTATGYKKKMAL